ncbi:MAG TPA: DUF1127 domain-containing protein [Pseudomonas sp.]|nr:DUF1127 domain-containing protein [Pseudomonas sp.]
MERTLEHDRPRQDQAQPSRWLRCYARLLYWQRNWRTRQHLARLDARQLADAGISAAQRQAELDKPFWR